MTEKTRGGQPGPTEETRRRLVQLAKSTAAGSDLPEVANKLGVSVASLHWAQQAHPGLWIEALDAVGCPDRAGTIVEAKTNDRRPDSPLRRFLNEVYLPSRFDVGPGATYQFHLVITLFDQFCGDVITVAELSDEVVCAFLKHRIAAGVQPSTVNANRAKLLALWNCAWRKRMHPERFRDVPRLREPRKIPNAWTVEDISRLVDYCRRLSGFVGVLPARFWWSSFVLSDWDTALRISSLRRVTCQDVDLKERTLWARSVQQGKQRADQLFALSDATVEMLAPIYDVSRPLLWPWPYCHDQLWKHFRRIVTAAGLEYDAEKNTGLFHRIRRTSLSYLAKVGIEVASQQAGHASIATTQRHYLHPSIYQAERRCDLLPQLDAKGGNGAAPE